MSPVAWGVVLAWLAIAAVVAVWRGVAAARGGKMAAALRRVKSPTIYLFAAYLLVAALVTPLSAGESTSPLLWLALALPAVFAASAFAAAGSESADGRARVGVRLAMAALFGGAVLAAAAVILALVSPAFVPAWMK